MRTIGILGGMGPEATADLYMSIVRIFQREYGAKYDSDFPPFLIASVPIPDIVESVENEKQIVTMLIDGVKKLEAAGADFIAIACNTVQIYLPQLRSVVRIPILSIPEEAMQEIKAKGYQKVGLLATGTTVKKELFARESEARNVQLITPNTEEQQKVTAVIMSALAGKKSDEDKQQLCEVIQTLQKNGAEAVILGCTELPLVIKEASIELLDTTQVLAWACVREARQNLFKQQTNGGE